MWWWIAAIFIWLTCEKPLGPLIILWILWLIFG